MIKIKSVSAIEILDSRGFPTIEAKVILEDNSIGIASSPSGASTGSLEACELRDNDKNRFLGKGVLKAVENVKSVINESLRNQNAEDQKNIDQILIDLDGTKNKSKLGANAILAASLAVAKAVANSKKIPLFKRIAEINQNINPNSDKKFTSPVPMMNIINGGKHADNKIDIQEFMIMPVGASSIKEAIRIGAEIFQHLKSLLKKDFHNTNVGDEGGFAPNLDSAKEAIEYILKAVERSGLKAGEDIVLALDSASSEFYQDNFYHLVGENKKLDSLQLIEYYQELVDNYPIFSIEDACSEHDFQGWKMITEKLGDKIQLVGDDLFVTNPEILTKGIADKMANALLVKFNQIGTLSETLSAINIAKKAGYNNIISHRSGETEDATISHIAVGTSAGQIKTGSLCRSDRTAKYNELIRIEESYSAECRYAAKSILKK
jgi:enolase